MERLDDLPVHLWNLFQKIHIDESSVENSVSMDMSRFPSPDIRWRSGSRRWPGPHDISLSMTTWPPPPLTPSAGLRSHHGTQTAKWSPLPSARELSKLASQLAFSALSELKAIAAPFT